MSSSDASPNSVQPGEAWSLLQSEPLTILLDVRQSEEIARGRIPGSTALPLTQLEERIETAIPDRDRRVLVYCASGVRSQRACRILRGMGYSNVASVSGGLTAWLQAGLPVATETTAGVSQRYTRHVRIPEIGEDGQLKLLSSRVLLVGAGGLGSPCALYLAAAGVGHLTIVDPDNVELSNLQRQVLHKTRHVGRSKVGSAREALNDLNPDVCVNVHATRLTLENAEQIVPGHHVVIDGSDNFATRYLVNDVCVKHRIPNVYASVSRFDGQAAVFVPDRGPCYRCLYPAPPPPDLAPTCEEAGVLGVLPGLLGMVQAAEALKLLLGIGQPLIGRLFCYDAFDATCRTFFFERNPGCAACSVDADIEALLRQPPVPDSCNDTATDANSHGRT